MTVVATEGGSSQTWVHDNGVSSSPVMSTIATIDLALTANASGVPALSGGGRIRILPKGKPD